MMNEIHIHSNSKNAPAIWGEGDGFEGVRGTSHNANGGMIGINDGAVVTVEGAGPGVYGESNQKSGVHGISHSPTDSGILGENSVAGGRGVVGNSTSTSGIGVLGQAVGGDAVFGNTTSGRGVFGHSHSGAGVVGDSDNNDGVEGTSQNGRGVLGNSKTNQGVYGHSGSNAGVVGESDGFDGVFGISHDPTKAGVSGHNLDGQGKDNPNGLAGWFGGNVMVTGDVQLVNRDCAEDFNVSCAEEIDPGTVMVIDQDGALRRSNQAYDRRVAGVVSGAGDCRPGIILGRQQLQESRLPVALVGTVHCKVDASYSPIEVGDLLTTSPTPGYAMKAEDHVKAFGSVIGKALRRLESGLDLVPVLVALQ
jgi:hypothetical protein